MRDFIDTMPLLPHRFDAETVERLRQSAESAPTPLERIVAGQCHSDACAQGRMRCPTPDACWREDHDGFVSATAAWFWRLYAAVFIVLVAAVVAWLL